MTSTGFEGRWRSSRNGRHENANERSGRLCPALNICPTQAKIGLEWATRPSIGLSSRAQSRDLLQWGARTQGLTRSFSPAAFHSAASA